MLELFCVLNLSPENSKYFQGKNTLREKMLWGKKYFQGINALRGKILWGTGQTLLRYLDPAFLVHGSESETNPKSDNETTRLVLYGCWKIYLTNFPTSLESRHLSLFWENYIILCCFLCAQSPKAKK